MPIQLALPGRKIGERYGAEKVLERRSCLLPHLGAGRSELVRGVQHLSLEASNDLGDRDIAGGPREGAAAGRTPTARDDADAGQRSHLLLDEALRQPETLGEVPGDDPRPRGLLGKKDESAQRVVQAL